MRIKAMTASEQPSLHYQERKNSWTTLHKAITNGAPLEIVDLLIRRSWKPSSPLIAPPPSARAAVQMGTAPEDVVESVMRYDIIPNKKKHVLAIKS
jgi:hypothetical protein